MENVDKNRSTMIRVSVEVRDMIEKEKIIQREPLNDCIKRGILQSRELKKQNPSLQTKTSLEIDLKEFVLNKNIPDTIMIDDPQSVLWNIFNPDDPILPGEMIHHINGNHQDNRPTNLKKIKRKDHGKYHSELNKKMGLCRGQAPK